MSTDISGVNRSMTLDVFPPEGTRQAVVDSIRRYRAACRRGGDEGGMAMDVRRNLLALQSEHEQDEAMALRWWRETSNADKMRVWDAIQQAIDDDDRVQEIVRRFAQLGMTVIALRAAMEEADGGEGKNHG